MDQRRVRRCKQWLPRAPPRTKHRRVATEVKRHWDGVEILRIYPNIEERRRAVTQQAPPARQG